MTDHFVEVPKKVLSPAAEAVLDAAVDAYGCNYSEFHCCADEIAAAALRAAAHHLQRCSPWTNDDGSIPLDWCTSELHDIAAELENAQ